MRPFRLVASAVVLCMAATSAYANDSSAQLGAGGLLLTKAGDIRMQSEDLRISPREVRVRYTFVNDGGSDVDTLVAFPLPDLDTENFWEEPLGTVSEDPVNFVDFAVTANGAKVPVSVEQRAIAKGRDVTAIVTAAGLPVNVLTHGGVAKVDALGPAARAKLKEAGLVEVEDAYIRPNWIVRTKFYWNQHFPAHTPVVIEHRYQPVTGQSFFTEFALTASGAEDGYLKPYCMDAPTLALVKKRMAQGTSFPDSELGPGMLVAYETDYILTTANNWKGPIGHFHLTIDKLKPSNVLSLCWDGALKKTGPTTFEAVRENFAPAHDIKLLVLE